jgi:tRNA(adenine34) deaminase
MHQNQKIPEADERFMARALRLADRAFSEDEVPVGAVVVYKNRIIAKGYNQVELLSDPTAHAEMIALTSASEYFRHKWLNGCTLYVTVEPCTMCAGAMVLARLRRVVFAASDPKTGAFGSKININKLGLNHKLQVSSGVLAQEASLLMSSFFQNKRRQK